mmetsp:Transcript_22804/g.33826  ORF Transcript_22804/g.33826 Transcript_22804/m.33826 type:complete len:93 (-) Transcript_22804:833-1111(-)
MHTFRRILCGCRNQGTIAISCHGGTTESVRPHIGRDTVDNRLWLEEGAVVPMHKDRLRGFARDRMMSFHTSLPSRFVPTSIGSLRCGLQKVP